MRAFESAVDAFGLAKVPRFRSKYRGADKSSSTLRRTAVAKKTSQTVKPISGCYKCPASDHYANDPKFHPVPPDGKHVPLSAETKKAIFDRIEASNMSAELKHAEKMQVKKYWSQHSL